MGEEGSEEPDTQVQVGFACFNKDIGSTVREELGDIGWGAAVDKARADHGFTRGGGKNPVVLMSALAQLHDDGITSATLRNIVHQIQELV